MQDMEVQIEAERHALVKANMNVSGQILMRLKGTRWSKQT
jgi:hypothetical protein